MPLLQLALVLMFAQDPLSDPALDAKVTFRQDASPLAKLVTNLGNAAKVKLSAAEVLDRQIVLVDVKDVRLGDAMAKLGDVTDCEWKPVAGGFVLSASPTKRAASAQGEVRARLKVINKAYDEYREIAESKYDVSSIANYIKDQNRKSNDRQGYFPNSSSESFSVKSMYGSAAPSGRTFARALLKIDSSALASLKCDERVVFSTSPNRMQRKLTMDLAQESKLVKTDNEIYQKGMELAGRDGGNSYGEFSPPRRDPQKDGPVVDSQAVETKISKIEIVAARKLIWFGMDSLEIESRVYDEDGNISDQHNNQLPMDANKLALFSSDFVENIKPKFDTKPDSLWHWQALTSTMADGVPRSGSDPRVASILGNPEKSEPLSFLTSDILIAASRSGVGS